MPPSIPCQRHLFDIPRDVCYLNCAYMSPQLRKVTATGREAVRLKAQPWQLGAQHWFDRVERARDLFAQLIGANADDVALVPSASYGIATAAQNCPIELRQTIVLLEEQFPSCVYPWLRRAGELGAEVAIVARPEDHDWTAAVLERIDARCAVVALPACHWADGGALDLVTIGAAARSVGARLVLDLSQSVGASPIDVAAVDPDWLCAPTYKWLMGPYAAGFVYVAPRNHGGRPLEENWIVREGSEDFSRLVDYQERYAPGARRYDVGERSNFVLVPMLTAGLEQVLEWEVPRVESSLRSVTTRLAEIGAEHGYRALPIDRRAPHILGLRREGGLPVDLVARLRERAVFVGTRGDAIRISPHLHVDEEDLERFRDALFSLG